MSTFQIWPGELPPGGPTIWLKCPRLTNSICHGMWEYVVENSTGLVEVPREAGEAILAHGRSGVIQVDPPTVQKEN